MDLNTFTIDQLPFQTSEALPKDCTKYEVMMGAVPDEKDDTNPNMYMDEIFAAGGNSPVPPTPVGPKDNEIWYWGEYYDLANAISVLESPEMSYVGPSILSNEQVGDKYVITFNGPVTKLGGNFDSGEFYPIFFNVPDMGIACNITGIEMPNSVTSIGNAAFGGCAGLASIMIPNSVTSIENHAFADCTGLSSITIPNSVTNIGRDAFFMGDHEMPYEYPIKTFIANGITYETNNNTSIDIVLANGNEVRLVLWDKLGGSVQVTVVDTTGGEHEATLDPNMEYADQGYEGYYSQDTYDSSEGESADDFSLDDTYPYNGETIYAYCNDIMRDITIYMESGESESVKLRSDTSFINQGYEGYYISDTYDSSEGETPETYSADNRYPGEELGPDQYYLDIIYNDIRDIASDEPEPEP